MKSSEFNIVIIFIMVTLLIIISILDFNEEKFNLSPCSIQSNMDCDQETCGDGICQEYEDEFNCFNDCNSLIKKPDNIDVEISNSSYINITNEKTSLFKNIKSYSSIWIIFIVLIISVIFILIVALFFKLKSEEIH